jgi:hypothetical protein
VAAAYVTNGWLVMPFAGNDLDKCFIGFGNQQPTDWLPAYKAYQGRRRVLQVRPPAAMGSVTVWVKVNGQVRREGTVRL